jgi:CRISPR-associated protein (TIGR03986 family)
MSVHAPFRFSPINRWVHFPDWADLVTHDVPFTDGLSGEVTFEIRADEPLLLGGARRKPPTNDDLGARPGAVVPFRLADGRYAIAGSSLQGLVRSILEIAAFAKLGDRIDRRRFAYRDVGEHETAKSLYRGRMTTGQGSKPGWLFKTDKGPVIVPCKKARIGFQDIVALRSDPANRRTGFLQNKSDAAERYTWFCDSNVSALNIEVDLAAPDGRAFVGDAGASTPATLIFTGKPQTGTNPGAKKLEFVFHTPNRASVRADDLGAILVPEEVWADFEFIHEPQKGRKINPNWGYWLAEYLEGKPIPVFFLEEGTPPALTTFGMAFMFKAAQPLSTIDLLENSTPDHCSSKPDLPSLIFGWAAGEDGAGLKRRASFDMAIAEPLGAALDVGTHPAILLSPKPSYFPLYVRQPRGPNGRLPSGVPYAVYGDFTDPRFGLAPPMVRQLCNEHKTPELNGAKVWPAVNGACTFPQLSPHEPPPPNGMGPGPSVMTELTALPKGTIFKNVKLRFHNLRQVELGALLWALTFGDKDNLQRPRLRHRLGMGKPLGMGVVKITVGEIALANGAAPTLSELLDVFEKHMAAQYCQSGDTGGWANSVQIQTLMTAADPEADVNLNIDAFKYMSRDECTNARSASDYLPLYVTGGEAARVDPDFPVGTRVGVGNTEGEVAAVTGSGKNRRFVVRLANGEAKPYARSVLRRSP